VLWGDGVTRQLYATDDDHVMKAADGLPLVATGNLPLAEGYELSGMFETLESGFAFANVGGDITNGEDTHSTFNMAVASSFHSDGTWTLYASDGTTKMTVSSDAVTVTIGGEDYVPVTPGNRRRLGHASCMGCNKGNCGGHKIMCGGVCIKAHKSSCAG